MRDLYRARVRSGSDHRARTSGCGVGSRYRHRCSGFVWPSLLYGFALRSGSSLGCGMGRNSLHRCDCADKCLGCQRIQKQPRELCEAGTVVEMRQLPSHGALFLRGNKPGRTRHDAGVARK